MSALAVDMPFDFNFPSASIERPSPPPAMPVVPFDQALLDMAYASASANAAGHISGHSRSSSKVSVYSTASAESDPESLASRLTTPPRASPPVRQHGPLLLPKIRSQDQDIDATPCGHYRMTTPPAPRPSRHTRSYTNPESIHAITFDSPATVASVNTPFSSQTDDLSGALLTSPANFATHVSGSSHSRRASSLDNTTLDKYGYPTYRQMPTYVPIATPQPQSDYGFASYNYSPRSQSPLSISTTPDPTPNTNLISFLTCSNPAASLVRTISFPLRDATTKHFWWDVRNIRSWSSFNAATILSLPGATAVLTSPVPASLLPQPAFTSRHPETEAALHSIYASYYLPKLNSALAMSLQPAHCTCLCPPRLLASMTSCLSPMVLASLPLPLPCSAASPLPVLSALSEASTASTLACASRVTSSGSSTFAASPPSTMLCASMDAATASFLPRSSWFSFATVLRLLHSLVTSRSPLSSLPHPRLREMPPLSPMRHH
ncbi:hypothetical protein NW754_004894 [Fusarium falciforme]|nr:hypothetical protein NW754_004894 [Fusarium falciforme]